MASAADHRVNADGLLVLGVELRCGGLVDLKKRGPGLEVVVGELFDRGVVQGDCVIHAAQSLKGHPRVRVSL